MDDEPIKTVPNQNALKQPYILRIALGGILVLGVLPGLLVFIAAGTTAWWQAWAVIIFGIVTGIVSRIVLIFLSPDLALERARWTEFQNVQKWDRYLVPLVGVYLPLVVWITAGLDHRFQLAHPLPGWLVIVGFGLLISGYGLGIWAMLVNRFFSAVARIQVERGHKVVDQGPYRIVRHPAYAGGVLAWVGTPLALSTPWAFIPVGIIIGLLILRTALEDRFLRRELPGYQQYAARTPQRLLPGIW